ncbi:MAG: DUF1698 domain-containing protein, partial [Cyanobacteria bacterium P01_H01_bin.121]
MTHPLIEAELPQDKLRQIQALRQQVPHWSKTAINPDPSFSTQFLRCDLDAVTIGQAAELTEAQHQALQQQLIAIRPWKKGPFNIFGHYIDAEWRSDWKWQRLQPHPDLKNKAIADIGCHNGYYMYRMLAYE